MFFKNVSSYAFGECRVHCFYFWSILCILIYIIYNIYLYYIYIYIYIINIYIIYNIYIYYIYINIYIIKIYIIYNIYQNTQNTPKIETVYSALTKCIWWYIFKKHTFLKIYCDKDAITGGGELTCMTTIWLQHYAPRWALYLMLDNAITATVTIVIRRFFKLYKL